MKTSTTIPFERSRSRIAALAVLGMLVALLMSCGGEGPSGRGGPGMAKGKDKADSLDAGVPVTVITADVGDIVSSVSFSATVESQRMAKVYPRTSGLVRSVLAEEGDRVSKGQVLVQLDHDDTRIALQRAQVELRKKQADSLRAAELFSKDLLSGDAYEQALYECSRARLDLDGALLTYRRARIRAPVDGVIATRSVEVGDRVGGSSAIYEMVTLDRLEAKVHIPGRSRSNLRVGQRANVTSDMLPGHRIDGAIRRISPVIDPQSGTVKVTVELHDPDGLFAPGMFASVALITDQRTDALLVPKETLIYDAGQAYAFTVKADTARRTRLELGLTNAREVQVVSGLADGDSIIVIGIEGLRDGALVRIVDDAKAPVPEPEPPVVSADSSSADSTGTAARSDSTGTDGSAEADTTGGGTS